MKFQKFDITFSEIPDETSLTFWIGNCGKQCQGCFSPSLQKDEGIELTPILFTEILNKYGDYITCVCFLGGKENEIKELLLLVKEKNLKIGWYTGSNLTCLPTDFDFIKTGEYLKDKGGLTSISTNQRFFEKKNGSYKDITSVFWQRNKP